MQQSTFIRSSYQSLTPSYRGKSSQWSFRVATDSEDFGGDVMINARRILATTKLHFLKIETARSASKDV